MKYTIIAHLDYPKRIGTNTQCDKHEHTLKQQIRSLGGRISFLITKDLGDCLGGKWCVVANNRPAHDRLFTFFKRKAVTGLYSYDSSSLFLLRDIENEHN